MDIFVDEDELQMLNFNSIAISDTQKKPQRKSRGRSRLGCSSCKTRHVKCDEQKPTCKRCMASGLKCDISETGQGLVLKELTNLSSSPKRRRIAPATVIRLVDKPPPAPSFVRPAINMNTKRSALEQEVFFRFAATFAPVLSGWQDQKFWLQTVLPAAQLHEPSFNALLALATLYDMPLSDTIRSGSMRISSRTRERYDSAIKWYCKSVNTSSSSISESPPAIALLLTTTILHIMVESRQGHYEATANLFRTAFAVVHASRACLQRSRDVTIFHCLARLLNLSIKLPIDSTGIPQAHRETVVTLALTIASDISVHPFHILDIQLAGITFDINDLVEGVTNNESDLQSRLDSWKGSFCEFETTDAASSAPKLALRLASLVSLYLQASLNLWRGDSMSHEELLQQRLLEFGAVTMFKASSTRPGSNPSHFALLKVPPIYILEAIIAPTCFSVVWYLRNIEVLATTSAIFESFRSVDERGFIDKLFEYCETLTHTPFDQATPLEEEIFGGRPLCLSVWRMHTVIHHLLREPGQIFEKLPGEVAIDARGNLYTTSESETNLAAWRKSTSPATLRIP